MKNILLSLLLCISALNIVLGNTLRIPQDYSTIQQAIDNSTDGDTIIVSRGTYFENINYRGKGIIITSEYLFTHDVADIEQTIINGSQAVNPDSASCVLMYRLEQSSSLDTSAALIGFTITGGKGTAWEDEHNLGSYYREGGGILIQYWAPKIMYNIIKNNEAYNKTGLTSAGGGGIRCGDGNPLIANNIIIENKGRYGGGIVLNYAGAVIRNNIIARNSGGEDFAGAGVWILGNHFQNKPKIILNNTIAFNASVLNGGGVFLWATNNTVLKNNILWGNTAPTNPQLRLTQATAEVTYNDIQGGYNGVGNINDNPDFDTINFFLHPGSLCIDAGDTLSGYNDPEDINIPGNAEFPSLGTLRNDMGAYGGPERILLPQVVSDLSDDENTNSPGRFLLNQNYPNPFNPDTKIKFTIQAATYGQGQYYNKVLLKIYDVLGEEVKTLINEEKPAGTYEVLFNGEALASGVYYYKLTSGNFSETKKMVLLK
jgi:hypothetical protein